MLQEIIEITIPIILFLIIVVPLGKYIYKVINFENSGGDIFFDKIDNLIYKITGVNKNDKMNWKQYAISFVVINTIMAVIAFIILKLQSILPLNPNKINNMETSLNFNTVISFITNTNLQDYSGESGVSYLSQILVMTFLMFTSAGTGFAAAAAFMRGLRGDKNFGNFFVDLVRICTRILLPLSIIVAVLLISQGVPQTFAPTKTITTIEGKLQDIALGPVASLESIKHLGTNGGGFLGANSAHPYENPSPLTNLIELLSMMALPGAIVIAFGHMIKNKKQAWAIFAAMFILFIAVIPVCFLAEKSGNPALAHVGLSQAMGNMEGKEVRFGIAQSSLFTVTTTSFTTGTVDCMHDSLTPMGGLIPLWQMMLNVVFGGKGVGFMNMLMYGILTVFICGLMIGRTPEFLRKKIETKEMILVATIILVDVLLILVPTAIALVTKGGLSGISNKGFHGLTQVLYQYTSSSKNNGSGFEGLADNTAFWNYSTGIVMLLGRYISMILLLAVAGSLASKSPVAESEGTFRTDTPLFVVNLIAIVLIIGALSFLPALALGPIAEHLTLKSLILH